MLCIFQFILEGMEESGSEGLDELVFGLKETFLKVEILMLSFWCLTDIKLAEDRSEKLLAVSLCDSICVKSIQFLIMCWHASSSFYGLDADIQFWCVKSVTTVTRIFHVPYI